MPTIKIPADLATSLDVWFRNYIVRADSIFVAAAYFDDQTVKRLLETVLNGGGGSRRLSIVLNATGSADVEPLQRLLNAQKQYPERVEVRCIKSQKGRLFHSKVFAAFCPDSVELVVGSGNLTRAAETNDELYSYLTFSPQSELSAKLKRTIDHWTDPEFSQPLTQELIRFIDSRRTHGPSPIHPDRGLVDNALDALKLGCIVTVDNDRPSPRLTIPAEILGSESRRSTSSTITVHNWVSGFVQLLPPETVKELDRIERKIHSSVRCVGLELTVGRYFVPLASVDDLQGPIKGFTREIRSNLKTALGTLRIRKHFGEARRSLDEDVLSNRKFESPEEKQKVTQKVDEFIISATEQMERKRAEWCSPNRQALKIEPHPARIRFAMPHDPAWKGRGQTPERQLVDAILDLLQEQLSAITDAARARTQTTRREAIARAKLLQFIPCDLTKELLADIKRATPRVVKKTAEKPRRKATQKKSAPPASQREIYKKCEQEVFERVQKHREWLQDLRKGEPIDALAEIWSQYEAPASSDSQ